MNYGKYTLSFCLLSTDECESIYSTALNAKTKMILLNTPHNPVGKVFTRDELEKIAALAEEFNLMVVSDEVVRG